MKKRKKHKPQPATKPASERPTEFVAGSTATAASPSSSKVVIREVGGEPTARRASVPVLLIVLLAGLVFWGDMYIIENGGQLDARVHSPYKSVKEIEDLLPKDETALVRAQGYKIYKQRNICAPCHQDDGNGSPSTFIPPLAGSDWVRPKDPSRIIRIVLNGLQGPVTVNGKEWGQAAMLPWRDVLTDEEVASVLTYVRNSWGNKAPPVNPEDVKKIRQETKDKGGSWSPDELLKIPLKE